MAQDSWDKTDRGLSCKDHCVANKGSRGLQGLQAAWSELEFGQFAGIMGILADGIHPAFIQTPALELVVWTALSQHRETGHLEVRFIWSVLDNSLN